MFFGRAGAGVCSTDGAVEGAVALSALSFAAAPRKRISPLSLTLREAEILICDYKVLRRLRRRMPTGSVLLACAPKGPKGRCGRQRPLKICASSLNSKTSRADAALQLHWNFTLLMLDFLRGLMQRPRELPFIHKLHHCKISFGFFKC